MAVGLARCLQDLAELEQATQLLDAVLASHPDDVAALLEVDLDALRRSEFSLESKLSSDQGRILLALFGLEPLAVIDDTAGAV